MGDEPVAKHGEAEQGVFYATPVRIPETVFIRGGIISTHSYAATQPGVPYLDTAVALAPRPGRGRLFFALHDWSGE